MLHLYYKYLDFPDADGERRNPHLGFGEYGVYWVGVRERERKRKRERLRALGPLRPHTPGCMGGG